MTRSFLTTLAGAITTLVLTTGCATVDGAKKDLSQSTEIMQRGAKKMETAAEWTGEHVVKPVAKGVKQTGTAAVKGVENGVDVVKNIPEYAGQAWEKLRDADDWMQDNWW